MKPYKVYKKNKRNNNEIIIIKKSDNYFSYDIDAVLIIYILLVNNIYYKMNFEKDEVKQICIKKEEIEIIKQTYNIKIVECNNIQEIKKNNEKEIDKTYPKSCKTCMDYVSGECCGIGCKTCNDYRPRYIFRDEEKRNWEQMGDASKYRQRNF